MIMVIKHRQLEGSKRDEQDFRSEILMYNIIPVVYNLQPNVKNAIILI